LRTYDDRLSMEQVPEKDVTGSLAATKALWAALVVDDDGNVVSASCRIYRTAKSPNPTLSASLP